MENELFAVGLKLSIEAHYKTYLSTTVLGWEKDVFVLTRAIYIQGQPAKLQNNDVCRIRFLKDGVAYGFETEIITIQFFPFPMMFLKYPANTECLKLRVAPRFKADIPVRLAYEKGAVYAEAIMLDISEGGCGVRVPAQNAVDLTPEQSYTITFKLLDRAVRITCAVRKLDKRTDFTLLGLEFTNIPQQQKETLALFLDFLKTHGAG